MPVDKEKLSQQERMFLLNLGFRIQYLRKRNGLSQQELAERCELSVSTISHLESTNIYSVSTVSLHRIAMALDVPIKSLFDFD